MGTPTGGVATKGSCSKRGLRGEECQLDELDCLRSPEQVIPLGLGAGVVAGLFLPCHATAVNTSLI